MAEYDRVAENARLRVNYARMVSFLHIPPRHNTKIVDQPGWWIESPMAWAEQLSTHCPLCLDDRIAEFYRDRQRAYLCCDSCRLVFVPPRYFPTPQEEKACYDCHQNRPDDPAYRRFLSRLSAPLTAKLSPGARGLDFGSGPGPTLSIMLAEAGFPTDIYDPFYAPDASVWNERYDFITASEVVEHLHRPMDALQRVWDVLKPDGWLGIMTKRVADASRFAAWHYKNDPTHVIFFAEETFQWLAAKWQARLEVIASDVVLLGKATAPPPQGRS